jgi:hypothetical protein
MKPLIKNTTILSSLIFAMVLLGCGQTGTKKSTDKTEIVSNNTLSDSERNDGWELLFDGETLTNWRGIGLAGVPQGHWIVEEGCIKKVESGNVPTMPDGQPVKGGDLITDTTFNNFILKFEWKVAEGANSGVKYNVIEEYSIENDMTGALGFEYQVIDDVNNKDISKPSQKTASLYDLIAAKNSQLKPVGEFNTSMILFDKNHGEHWLNGVKVVEYQLDSPEFQKLFKKSKYHEHTGFTKHKIARIVLQDHGNECWYRNVKIKRLKD